MMPVVLVIAALALFMSPVQAEQKPLCTCAIVDQCEKTVAGGLSSCWAKCSSNFKDYETETDKLKACFPGISEEINAVDKCIRKKIQGFCSAEATNATVAKPDTAAILKAYNVTDGEKFGNLIKKARTAFVNFRRFHYCFSNCVKENALACHETKGCAASIPSPADFNTAVEECEKERNFGQNASLACKCLVVRSRAKSLVGVCTWFANKHFMKAL